MAMAARVSNIIEAATVPNPSLPQKQERPAGGWRAFRFLKREGALQLTIRFGFGIRHKGFFNSVGLAANGGFKLCG